MFEVVYHPLVVRDDIPKLKGIWKDRIRRAILGRLTTSPDLYGKHLRRSLAGYRKLRVGDYRIIFKLEGKKVKIIIIQHRSEVYKEAHKQA